MYACMRREHNIWHENKLLQLLKQLYLNTCIEIHFEKPFVTIAMNPEYTFQEGTEDDVPIHAV